jgi:hypothetical protein
MFKTVVKLTIPGLLACGFIFGQVIVSSIVGRVTDSSGAAVPGAQVTVTNTQTGMSVRTATTTEGTYSVPGLLAGTYNVKVEKPSFQVYTGTGITLQSSETARVDVHLAVSNIQQSVSVEASAAIIQTDSSSIGSSVTNQQLSELPTQLQTVDAFIALAPGVQSYQNSTNPPIGGGTHWGSVNFTLNGAEINDPGNSGGVTIQGSGGGLLVLPPPSALQELSIQSNGMTAQYRGKSTVTLVTKGGTNRYHGELYEYFQNTDLDANTFILNSAGKPRAPDHLNQFGGNIGGPIKRNKAFFFFNYGGYRHAFSTPVQLVFPSAAMRTGDFSALCTGQGGAFNGGICSNANSQLYNPFTGQAFPNNQIPGSMITSQAKALLQFLPLPTVANSPGLPNGPINYVSTAASSASIDAEDVRIDYNLSGTDRLFGVYSQRVAEPWGVTANYPQDYGQRVHGYKEHAANASETHTFGPNTINELRVAWGEYATKFNGQNANFDTTSLWPQNPEAFYRGLPTITASGYTGLWYDYGTGQYTPRRDVEFADDFTHVKGRHTIQAGIDETGYKMWNRVPSNPNTALTGAFGFNGQWTGNRGWPGLPHSNGNGFADFLLGTANTSATSALGDYAQWLYARYWGFYAQDTWQVSPHLTLILGMRYEYQPPWHYRAQEITTFDFRNGKLVLPENSATPTLPAGAVADQFAAYPFETTQSIGQPVHIDQGDTNNFAPRFGFALRPFRNQRTVIRGGFGIYYNFQPGLVGSGREAFNPPWPLAHSATYTTSLPGNPTKAYLPDLTFANPFPGVGASTVEPNPTINYFPWNFQNAMAEEWSLTLEQQLGTNWAVRGSYIGSKTDHLPYNAVDLNRPAVQIPNVPLQNQRPYQPWSTVGAFMSSGYQNFNQMQLGLKKRYANGLSFQAEYQYTRSLDNIPTSGGWQNPANADLDYGNSTGLRRHWMVSNFIYALPFGSGRTFLGNAGRLVNSVVGGWQVSGIATYGSGVPINLTFSTTGTGIVGWWGGRPDVVAGAPLYAGQQDGHNIIGGVQWFNPAAFAPPAKWAWGNAARDMIFGPGLWNWDMSGMKSFAISDRLRLQFRADFLDAFNHMNLDNPDTTIPDTRDRGTPDPRSGKITAGSGNRTVQLALKLTF